jgi:hypothetical protein
MQRSLSGIDALCCCTALTRLTLQSCRKLVSIKGLEGCKRLKILSAFQVGTFSTIDSLTDHDDLHYLVLTQGAVNKDTDIEALYTLRSLQTLIIDRRAPIHLEILYKQNPRMEIHLANSGH